MKEFFILKFIYVRAPGVDQFKQGIFYFLLIKVIVGLRSTQFCLLLSLWVFLLTWDNFVEGVVIEVFFYNFLQVVSVNAWSQDHPHVNENSEVLISGDVALAVSPEFSHKVLDCFLDEGVSP